MLLVKNNILFISCLLLLYFVSIVLSYFSENVDFVLSCVVVILFSLILLFSLVNKERVFSLKNIYLYGFFLFICGRFFSYLLSSDVDVFKFDFGFSYFLSGYENKVYLFTLVYGSVFFFLLANVLDNRSTQKFIRVEFLSNKDILYVLAIVLCFLILKDNVFSIVKSMSEGYLSLYQSQSEEYSTPLLLILNAILISLISLFYINNFKENKTKIIIVFFALIQLLTIATGARGGFVSVLLLLGWLFLYNKKFSLKSMFLLLCGGVSLIFIINLLLTFSTRSSEDGGFLDIVVNTLTNQGITLMVFDLSTKISDYPFLGVIKTFIPGSQLFFHYFVDNIQVYDVSFPHYLTFYFSPELYDEGYGFGWSLLSDFYVFSFSNMILFFLFSFVWGRIIYRLDYYNNSYQKGLAFIFATQLFMVNRGTVSTLVAYALIYTILYIVFFRVIKYERVIT